MSRVFDSGLFILLVYLAAALLGIFTVSRSEAVFGTLEYCDSLTAGFRPFLLV